MENENVFVIMVISCTIALIAGFALSQATHDVEPTTIVKEKPVYINNTEELTTERCVTLLSEEMDNIRILKDVVENHGGR